MNSYAVAKSGSFGFQSRNEAADHVRPLEEGFGTKPKSKVAQRGSRARGFIKASDGEQTVMRQPSLNTRCVRAAHAPDPATGAVAQPIYLTTTFERAADRAYSRGYRYSREGTPNRVALESCMAAQGMA